MSVDLPQHCDDCGRQIAKAHRVHRGYRYCATCYSRVFKRRMCPKCGNIARLPKSDPTALCHNCETNKPCIRCGKVRYAIGRITAYGPVCNSCSPHFRKPEPCEVCGVLSPRLTRVSRLEHGCRVCPKCARIDHSTCPACTRHRRLQEAPDGRMLCRACSEKGELPCPQCREPMPAGRGRQCHQCYWKGLLEKRIRMDCAAFSSPRMVAYFEAFGNWLREEVGENKAALTVHRYLSFFLEVERQWKGIPKYTTLLEFFGAAKLRRVLLPMRWMEETGLVTSDAAAKAEDSDRRRIAVTLDRLKKSSKARLILQGYHKALLEDLKAGKTTLRSIRLALSPAATLLWTANERERMPPDQGVVEAYLGKTPGQRASVARFVRYLREEHGAKITLPKANPDKAQRRRRKKLEAKMLALMQEGGESDEFKLRWISVTLAYFHGLPQKVGGLLREQDLNQVDGGMFVTWGNKQFWLPACSSESNQLQGSPAFNRASLSKSPSG